MRIQEAMAAWQNDKARGEELGIHFPQVRAYVSDEFKSGDVQMALDAMVHLGLDAQPSLVTDPNSAVPAMLTTLIDPDVYRVLFAPNKAAEIFGEVKKGTWLDETAMFPIVEHSGEVSTYGDYSDQGRASVNTNWPQRQAYLYQIIEEYGDRELERAGLARINWVTEIEHAAATNMNKFQNYTYFYGVAGLQNFGLLNDPGLTAAITPALKAYSTGTGTKWVVSGVVMATANEIFTDIQSMFYQLQVQNNGLVDADSKMTLALHPAVSVALTQTNTFNVNVSDLLKKNFPNLKVETAVQYGASSSSNTQGSPLGNIAQLFVDEVEGQDTGYCSFNEKAKAFPIVRAMSSYKRKLAGGSWGSIVRWPAAITTMVGL